jgi:hypothetical protein
VINAHLIEVIAPLHIEHHHQTQHFFTSQLHGVLRLFWQASIFPINVLEIPLTSGKKSFTKRLVVEDEGDGSPLNLL